MTWGRVVIWAALVASSPSVWGEPSRLQFSNVPNVDLAIEASTGIVIEADGDVVVTCTLAGGGCEDLVGSGNAGVVPKFIFTRNSG